MASVIPTQPSIWDTIRNQQTPSASASVPTQNTPLGGLGDGGTTSTKDLGTGDITGGAIGAGAQVVSSIIKGAAHSSNVDKLRDEAYAQAMTMGHLAEQQDIAAHNIGMASQRLQEQSADLDRRRDTFLVRFDAFVNDIKKYQKTITRQTELADGIATAAKNNDEFSNILLNNWGV